MGRVSYEQVREALRRWHDADPDVSPLDPLLVYRRGRVEGKGVREATNAVLQAGLDIMAGVEGQERLQAYWIISQRYVEGTPTKEVALRLHRSEPGYMKIQQGAISLLTEIVNTKIEKPYLTILGDRIGRLPEQGLVGLKTPVEQLSALLRSSQAPAILSLEGMGGIGKTTLARALVTHLLDEPCFYDLAWVSAKQRDLMLQTADPRARSSPLPRETLVRRILSQLGQEELSQTESFEFAWQALKKRLHDYPHLIVVDNLETIEEQGEFLQMVQELVLPTRFLLTSRESRPDLIPVYHFKVRPLSESDTLQFIREEARHTNHPYLSDAPEEALRKIYEGVGGNPLALRLLIALSHHHTLETILSDLRRAGSDNINAFYDYLYPHIWESLHGPAQALWLAMRLVPEEGAESPYLEKISALEQPHLHNGLNSLVTLGLVTSERTSTEVWYTIHPVTRAYLQSLITQSPAIRAIADTQVRYAEAYLLQRLDSERDTLPPVLQKQALHTLNYSLAEPELWATSRQLLLALSPRMEQAGERGGWMSYLQKGLEQATEQDDKAIQAELLFQIGVLLLHHPDLPEAQRVFEESAMLWGQVEAPYERARSLNRVANVLQHQGKAHEARAKVDEARALIAKVGGGAIEEGYVAFVLGSLARNNGQADEVERQFQTALELWRKTGNRRLIGWGLTNLGVAFRERERYDLAQACYLEAIGEFEKIGDIVHLAIARMNLGNVYQKQGKFREALHEYELVEQTFHMTGDGIPQARLSVNKGTAHLALGQAADKAGQRKQAGQHWKEAAAAFQLGVELFKRFNGSPSSLTNAMDGLATVYRIPGQRHKGKALTLSQDALEMGQAWLTCAHTVPQARTEQQQLYLQAAETVLCLSISLRESYDKRDAKWAEAMDGLGMVYLALNQADHALTVFQAVLEEPRWQQASRVRQLHDQLRAHEREARVRLAGDAAP